MQSTRNSKLIKAPVKTVFDAFSSAEALEKWLAPDTMTGKVHHFDFRSGGGYEMSLYYPEEEQKSAGKTNEKEDRSISKFIKIVPNEKIVQTTVFDSDNKGFAGEMKMEVTFEPKNNNTLITFVFTDIPPGIKPEDNEEGTRQSLEKLAKFIESKN